MPTLYLDFDGVLHPNAAYIDEKGAHLRPPFEYHELFENAPILAEILANIGSKADALQIIISSTWVMEFGLDECIARLPNEIGKRVTGATWRPETLKSAGVTHDIDSPEARRAWRMLSRYDQISAHAGTFEIGDWIAIDDHDLRWPEEERSRLVHCDERDGISRKLTQADCVRAIERLVRPDTNRERPALA